MNRSATRARDRTAKEPRDHPDANDRNRRHPSVFRARTSRLASVLRAVSKNGCASFLLHARSKLDMSQQLVYVRLQIDRASDRSIRTDNRAHRGRASRRAAAETNKSFRTFPHSMP